MRTQQSITISPLAQEIQLQFVNRGVIPYEDERTIYDTLASRGYKPATVYLAMCELYQAGIINRKTSH